LQALVDGKERPSSAGDEGLFLFNIENLVLGARSEFNGFAGTGANHFGVLECWLVGVLEKRVLIIRP
jgi:hypothetical protein